MLGAFIALVNAGPGWDDTGVSAGMVLTASGLAGALHPRRVRASAGGSWIPLFGIVVGRLDYASLLALVLGSVALTLARSPLPGERS